MITPADAQNFYREGMAELDKIAVGEQWAKSALLANMVMGESILLIGPPGGAKTKLAGNAYRLVEGIDLEHVATIPPSAELSATQLVGGYVESETEVTKDGHTTTEVKRTKVEPIIKPDTKVLWANEINRMNPYGLNAALEAYEDGTVITTAGTVVLDGLEFGVSTMNPGASKYATFSVDPAMASRHTLGAELGRHVSEAERYHIIGKIREGFTPQPDKIEPKIDLHTLHQMREQSVEVPVPDDIANQADRIVANTTDMLRQQVNGGIDEADGRIATQIFRVAKTLAFLGAQERVEKKDLRNAVISTLTARLGALSVKSIDIIKLADQIIA